MAELVDARDLKSLDFGRTSSILVPGTMQGTWRAASATLETNVKNIAITFNHVFTIDMSGNVIQRQGPCTIESGDLLAFRIIS